jgi:nucleoside-diphosphate-sugar epimerase
MPAPICITGATGYVGSHIVEAFLAAGIPVRAAVRSPDDTEKTAHLHAMAERHGAELTLHAADLGTPGSFDAALEGCEGLVHVAAVARLTAPDPQAQIVDPSVEGARNVLAAATAAGVRRVVLTSSVAAIGSYRASQDHPLTEADWNDAATLDKDPYGLAKTSAERLAWELADAAPWDLVVCNPAMVLGPVFNKRHCKASPVIVRDILLRSFPANPRFCFGIVDARDVAAAHLAAFQRPDAHGRHLLCAGNRWMRDMAVLLEESFRAFRIRTGTLPNLALRAAALFDKRMDKNMLADILDREPHYDGSHATRALGITYRDIDQSVIETARSMVEQGLVAAR